MKGWRITCPSDTGDGRHLAAVFRLPEMTPAQTESRWSGVDRAFGLCPCGAQTAMVPAAMPAAPAKAPTLDEVNAAWAAAGRDVSGRNNFLHARAFYRGVLDEVRVQQSAPKGVYRAPTDAERVAITLTRKWIRATATKRGRR